MTFVSFVVLKRIWRLYPALLNGRGRLNFFANTIPAHSIRDHALRGMFGASGMGTLVGRWLLTHRSKRCGRVTGILCCTDFAGGEQGCCQGSVNQYTLCRSLCHGLLLRASRERSVPASLLCWARLEPVGSRRWHPYRRWPVSRRCC